MNRKNEWIDDSSKQGLVSVIMPSYNRENFILQAIESVFKQNYRPIELVIADDGSTDNTESKISEWIARTQPDSDFTLIYSRKPNGGASSARNWGARHSNGEFILFLDSDDYLLPGAIDRAVEHLRDDDLPYVYFRVQLTDANLQPKKEFHGREFAGTDNDLTDYLWHTMSPVYRRSTVKKVGPWSEELTAVDDWEYGTRVKLMGFRGKFDPSIIGFYRDHQEARLNVYSFNPSYVLNCEKACDLIVQTAKEHNRMSPVFRKRVALRLIVHAVEFGMNRHLEDCRRLLEKAQQLLPDSAAFQAGTGLLKRFKGPNAHRLLWRAHELRLKAKA